MLRKLDLPFSEDIFTETADDREGAEHLREGTNATRSREGTLQRRMHASLGRDAMAANSVVKAKP
jgi:hypothetical protein